MQSSQNQLCPPHSEISFSNESTSQIAKHIVEILPAGTQLINTSLIDQCDKGMSLSFMDTDEKCIKTINIYWMADQPFVTAPDVTVCSIYHAIDIMLAVQQATSIALSFSENMCKAWHAISTAFFNNQIQLQNPDLLIIDNIGSYKTAIKLSNQICPAYS